MAEIYPLGKNRLFYKSASNINTGKLTVHLVDPDLIYTEVAIELIKVEGVLGLYYFEATFSKEGTYIAIFYEDGREKISQAFSTRRIPAEGVLRIVRAKGPNVIG